jgi:23S rRNA pseudouridine1911/1915/1917 synthase
MLNIFYEDQELIVVKKPVGIESQETHSFSPDLVSEIKKHIHHLSTKKEEPYVGVIHRLDKPVGGIMVYAKTKEAASLLSRQIKENQMQKMYMAVVCGKPVDNVDNFVDYLLKDTGKNMSRIVEKGISGAKRAELRYQVVDTFKEEELLTLVKIWLITGRHHQIRVQFAGRGMPLWGDHRYNPKFAGQKSIALSACELSFLHPKTKKPLTFQMEPEGEIFQRFFKNQINGI